MASATVYGAVRQHLMTFWSATSLRWENETFKPPSVAALNPAWVAVEMFGTAYGQESLGAGSARENRWDEDGHLWLHVFVPVGSGSATARGHAKALANLFRGTLLLNDALEFGDASIGLGEPGDDDGLWWRVSVSIAWRHMDA